MTLTVAAATQNIKYYTIVDIGTYLHEFPNQEFNWQIFNLNYLTLGRLDVNYVMSNQIIDFIKNMLPSLMI